MEPLVSRVTLATGLSYEVLEVPARDAIAETLLLLHGFLDSAWGWLPAIETGLLSRYRLLVPSLRGHGASDWIGAGGMYYFFDYTADLVSLLESHAPGRVLVAGHSMGGMVAAQLAGTFPERVARVALMEGISVPESPSGPARLREAIAGSAKARSERGTSDAPGSKRYASLADAAARMRHHDALLDERTAISLAERACLRLGDGQWVFRHDPLHATRSPVGFELAVARRFFAEVRCDVLYLEGERSHFRLTGDDRRQRLASFERATSLIEHTVAGAGHMMLRHAPEATARALADFFAGGAR